MLPEALCAPGLAARHGFFTRQGGVSQGAYASLNCGMSGDDNPDHVAHNRTLVAQAMDLPPDALLGLKQIHSADVVTVTDGWAYGAGPRADAMVTARRGWGLGIITADCAPVLFADQQAGVIGAAHAGWTGAVAGVVEATLEAMVALGATATRIVAAIGPCIRQPSYEVGPDLRDTVVARHAADARFFQPGRAEDRWQFDLAGYVAARVVRWGATPLIVPADTLPDEERFFSHRRRTLAGGGKLGHQISVIAQ